MPKHSQIPPQTSQNPLKNHRKTLKNATLKHLAKRTQKNAILEPTWSELGAPKQKQVPTRRSSTGYATPSQRSFAPPKGMGRPEPNRLTHEGYETPAHCDASRISAGVHFRESAPAGPNHAKHFLNLPTMCSKDFKSSQISSQTLPKPSQNLPKIH